MTTQLAINGGEKTVQAPFPSRGHFGIEEKIAVDAVMDKAIATGNAPGYGGDEEMAYCGEFAEFMGGGFADGVNSGTNAVYVALKALNPEPFSEIIVSGVTDPGGMMPIPLLNCIPVVADTAPDSYNVGPEQVEELVSPLTSAIVVAHIGGEPVDMPGIMKIAAKHGIPVVEDCSQSHGAKLNGKMVGTFGDIAAFSTMFGKHHCTGGQGGVVFTRDEKLHWQTKRAADRGKPFGLQGHTNVVAALNCNLDEIAAAIGRAQLRKLPEIVSARRNFVELLKKAGIDKLRTITIPELVPGSYHSYWWWRLGVDTTALTCSRNEFLEAVLAEGVALAISYRGAMPHSFDWFRNRSAFGTGSLPWSSPEYRGEKQRRFPCPNAEAAMDKYFNLMIAESWTGKEAELIAQAFAKVERAMLG